ncbi:Ribulosamine/erythrulosamine 3-kinase potentially involved in protein deglycation [Halomonas citrativorans]|uniref:Ribulosamine/erythrulosamine 3-kinase potentially involved in protein deglycation n=1 Tax=Halomonas citrativorans TaxID=2742612 RepID=A0A1R4I5G1_9GAMM|nr:Ribulosamine/erythrulosamine 3-kinase potentially involved in protein deglycation [Halomonas citrativorans]
MLPCEGYSTPRRYGLPVSYSRLAVEIVRRYMHLKPPRGRAWLPEAPASLLHGDLWSGNVLITTRGPALIDPAVYRHYSDVDIAMLTLFGSPGSGFFDAYWEGNAPPDWSRREALFQLCPLLNHLLLFGATYRTDIEQRVAILETYAQ